MVIAASPVKRQRRVLATLKHGQWSSPLRRSSVNVRYLRHGSTDSGHLRFAGQASTSGTCDTEARTVVISASPVKRQRQVLATRKHGQWSSPLRRSSVNVGYLRHGSTDSGHLRFAGQASTSGTCDTEARTVVISASPVKRQRRVLATLKHGQWSSPLRRSSVNVRYLRHGSTDSGHLRFAGQASTSGTCDTEARTVVISASPVKRQRRVLATLKHGQWSSPLRRFAHLRHSHTRLVGCETEIGVPFAIDETFFCSSQ